LADLQRLATFVASPTDKPLAPLDLPPFLTYTIVPFTVRLSSYIVGLSPVDRRLGDPGGRVLPGVFKVSLPRGVFCQHRVAATSFLSEILAVVSIFIILWLI
jgi:hypothetical protein